MTEFLSPWLDLSSFSHLVWNIFFICDFKHLCLAAVSWFFTIFVFVKNFGINSKDDFALLDLNFSVIILLLAWDTLFWLKMFPAKILCFDSFFTAKFKTPKHLCTCDVHTKKPYRNPSIWLNYLKYKTIRCWVFFDGLNQGCLQFIECLGREGVGIGQYNLLSSIFINNVEAIIHNYLNCH